jgi:hypothetical protein
VNTLDESKEPLNSKDEEALYEVYREALQSLAHEQQRLKVSAFNARKDANAAREHADKVGLLLEDVDRKIAAVKRELDENYGE